MSAEMSAGRGSRLELAVLIGVSLGALLLTVAELTTLCTIHIATSRAAIRSIATGADNHYAMIPIALLALLLAGAVWQRGTRIALLAIAVLGILALVLAIAHDLPDAQRSGLLRPSPGRFAFGKASPSAGLYMETLGAVILLATGVCALLVAGEPSAPRPPNSPQGG